MTFSLAFIEKELKWEAYIIWPYALWIKPDWGENQLGYE